MLHPFKNYSLFGLLAATAASTCLLIGCAADTQGAEAKGRTTSAALTSGYGDQVDFEQHDEVPVELNALVDRANAAYSAVMRGSIPKTLGGPFRHDPGARSGALGG